MTNEEKMLDILASMSLRLDAMDARMSEGFATLDDRMTKLEFKIETDIEPRLDALAEGQSAILEQLTPRSRVDELESRVKFLEVMLRQMSEDLQKIKAG